MKLMYNTSFDRCTSPNQWLKPPHSSTGWSTVISQAIHAEFSWLSTKSRTARRLVPQQWVGLQVSSCSTLLLEPKEEVIFERSDSVRQEENKENDSVNSIMSSDNRRNSGIRPPVWPCHRQHCLHLWCPQCRLPLQRPHHKPPLKTNLTHPKWEELSVSQRTTGLPGLAGSPKAAGQVSTPALSWNGACLPKPAVSCLCRSSSKGIQF